MLQDIRDNTQGVIAKVIIGLIVAVFALWGVESIIGGFIRSPAIAEVNGEEINEQQLAIATQNLLASIGGSAEGIDQGLLEQIALSQLIEEILLRQSAENNGMQISDDRIDRVILESPAFQIDGVFDQNLAVRTIASQGMNVPLYREQLKRNMVLSQIANAFSSSTFVTEDELARIAALRLQTRDFRFISLTLGTRTLGEAIPDADIAEYYETNVDEFTVPEQVRVQYVELNKAQLMEQIQVDESTVREQYERERTAFVGGAERRASHILFEVGAARTEEQAMQEATAAKQRLDQGEDFGALAREVSSDVISAEQDGDIGYSDGSAFPQAIEDALLALAVNQVSDPVVSEFGVHLVKLTEDAVTEFAAYEEVAERIIREMKSVEAEQLFAERLEDMSNMAFEAPDLSAIAEQLQVQVQESEFFSRSGGNGIFANSLVINAVFSEDVLENFFNSDVIELSDSQAVVLRVVERTEAQVRPIDEVEGEIAVILRTELEKERAQALGQQIVQQLLAGQPIDQMLQENELEWIAQGGVTRSSTTLNREIINAVFAMPGPEDAQPVYQGVGLTNGTYVVVELSSVNPGDLASMPEQERDSIVQAILSERSQAEFRAYLAKLREDAEIVTRELPDPVL